MFKFEPFPVRCTYSLRQSLCTPYSVLGYRSPVPLAQFRMAPTPSTLMSSGSIKKEPRYTCLSEAKASHSDKMWYWGFLLSTIFPRNGVITQPHRCLLKVLCPASRSITTLDYVLLKDNNRAFVARFRARDQFPSLSLCATGTTPHCQLLVMHPALTVQ